MRKCLDLIVVFVVESVLIIALGFCVFEIFNMMALYKDQVDTAGNIEMGKSLAIWIISLQVFSVILGLTILIVPYLILKWFSRHSKD